MWSYALKRRAWAKVAAVMTVVFLCVPAQSVGATTCPMFSAPSTIGQLDDPRWTGISGLAATRSNRGAWWIHNDRGVGLGEAGRFYAILSNGALLREYTLTGVADLETPGNPVDVEDIAVGRGPALGMYLYLGDIGGNRYSPFGRPSVRLFRLREPRVDVTAGTQPPLELRNYTTLTLNYPNGERYDAETLMIDANGDIYIVTKDGESGVSHVYYVPALPEDQTTATMTRIATLRFGVGALEGGGLATTSGSMSPRGKELVIRTYNRIFLWQKVADGTWSETFAETVPCRLPAAPAQSYEAVTFDYRGFNVYTTFESTSGDAAILRYGRSAPTQLPLIVR
jgi:hypothetical protein